MKCFFFSFFFFFFSCLVHSLVALFGSPAPHSITMPAGAALLPTRRTQLPPHTHHASPMLARAPSALVQGLRAGGLCRPSVSPIPTHLAR